MRHRFEVRADSQLGLNQIILQIAREFSAKAPLAHVVVSEWELATGQVEKSTIIHDWLSDHHVVFANARTFAREMEDLRLEFVWLTVSYSVDPIRLHRNDCPKLPWADGNAVLWEQPFAPQLRGACLELIIFDASHVVITLSEKAPDWVCDACMNVMLRA